MQREASAQGASLDRRELATLAAAVAGVAGLAACSGSGDGSGDGSGNGAGSTAATASGGLVALSAVPVGGAVVVDGPDGALAVAQPASGTVVAHSAVCTHQGCKVLATGARLACPCHGSVFDAATGAVLRGPAARPLPAVKVTVQGQQVVAG